ncbi:hypothetical protein AAZX31_20G180400 [Glycine max]|uniref:DUF4220 domain-containing protein n=2 Tax=Glycine subgen. Soja TaxID=1462606 RepID=K7N4H2_SOYBN|nr:uncharacterized protein LOC102661509 [Glycine max]XP_028221742.1 uncharacterized protein LOC114403157 [Glycine soja]KAG4908225.1 hypothetical protein JHK86_056709 [Glycine max]KAG4919442.1 hypothetical protein JHK85_057723 [Glycine max]KAG5075519.1 hypothetical protein JHK84_056750 [Glycine max]KAG5078180.1 hypothetical protein JHK82_056875 [Glycine max]KAH1036934.1 hypothetical protein GYH30_056380 [Glycine max]|eukprot:XP_006606311.1 uncharacterized protein LOC102661509 [Glycine max]
MPLAVVWKILELRVLVLLSLAFQIMLIVFGNQRKYQAGKELQLVVWVAYLLADLVATYVLGILSKDSKDHPVHMAIWAPFLLVHLGGPDTITAYALEDNELWKRHFLGIMTQIFGAVYVVYSSWNGSKLNYVTIPVMVAGVIKYGERTWSLWCGSSEKFRESILPPPDPGPNYAKFMDDCTAKKAEGYKVELKVKDTSTLSYNSKGAIANENVQDALLLHDGFYFFKIFERLFADLILSIQELKISRNYFQHNGMSWERAFKVIEVELGLMYDKLYTKAVVTYCGLGFGFGPGFCFGLGLGLKSVTLFCTLSAFITFLCLTDKAHMDFDQIITAVLFAGAILLEICAGIIFASSSWTMFWLSTRKNWIVDLLILCFQRFYKCLHAKRWSNRISQFNLMSFCLKCELHERVKIWNCQSKYQLFKKFHQKPETVSKKLKEVIFEQIRGKSKAAKDIEKCKKFCAHRGDGVLRALKCNCNSIAKSTEVEFDQSLLLRLIDSIAKTTEVEFDQSLLLWHIATDLCLYSDKSESDANCAGLQNYHISKLLTDCMLWLWHIATDLCCFCYSDESESNETDTNCAWLQNYKISKLLSNYMLYLLVECPFMLPNGIGQIRFKDTCAEVSEILQERKYISETDQICKVLDRVSVDEEFPPTKVKGDRSKSVLFDAQRLAKSIKSLEQEMKWSKEEKWRMISRVWVEMLCHAASQCRGFHHAKQLSRGGELLTHVWLLMAHLGITEQLQISKGHARAKLLLS